MNYFIVFQNKTFKEEKNGQYLWAPQRNNRNGKVFHWENMKKVQPGDIIFSMYRQEMVSVNVATKKAIEANNPFIEHEKTWARNGWLVKADYKVLSRPVSMKKHMNEILPLCPPKYSPFTRKGTGAQGYLFEIDVNLGDLLLELAKRNNSGLNLNK